MSIFQRTIKLVLATSLAIFLADGMGLAYASSAGVIALLSILETRQSSFQVAGQRFLASLLAFGVAYLVFGALGFSLLSVTVFLSCYLPLAYVWRLGAGVAPSTVLVLHLVQDRSLSAQLLGNELALLTIGVGLALLFNAYMPSKEAELLSLHQDVEDKLKQIMRRFKDLLLSGDGTNQAILIKELDQLLDKALMVAYLDRHNQVFRPSNYHVHYFTMRQDQARLLRNMAGLLNRLDQQSPEGLLMAQLFDEVAQQLSQTNSGVALLEDIDQFLETFRQRDLPQTRQEFEARATLFQLLHDMRAFIAVKITFYDRYQEIIGDKLA